MPDQELVDIVDDKNRIIGKEIRGTAHAKGLLHRASHVFVFNSKGEVFLQKRASTKKICPSLWDFSTAEHLHLGETYLQAALRGIKEELGITVKKLEQIREGTLQTSTHDNGRIKENEFVALFRVVYDGPIKMQASEIDDGRFFTVPEVKRLVKKDPGRFTDWFKLEWGWMESKGLV